MGDEGTDFTEQTTTFRWRINCDLCGLGLAPLKVLEIGFESRVRDDIFISKFRRRESSERERERERERETGVGVWTRGKKRGRWEVLT